jgi:dihydroxy-acid dehydratase
MIVFDLAARRLDLDVTDDVLHQRMLQWRPPPPRYTTGVLAKYAAMVGPAAAGAVTTPHLVAPILSSTPAAATSA